MKSKDTTCYLLSLLACFYLGCGGGDKPADKNSTAQGANPGGDGAAKSTTVELAAFIKGKRVWVVEPESTGGSAPAQAEEGEASSPESKANESSPDKSGDECEVEAKAGDGADEQKEELLFQFNEDATFQVGGRNQEGEAVAFPNGVKGTYVVKGLEVIISGDGKEAATVYFGSNEPKAGDDISFGKKSVIESGGKKTTTKIIKIEPATKLKAMKFEVPEPDAAPDANDPGDSSEGDAGADDTSGDSPEKK